MRRPLVRDISSFVSPAIVKVKCLLGAVPLVVFELSGALGDCNMGAGRDAPRQVIVVLHEQKENYIMKKIESFHLEDFPFIEFLSPMGF